MKYIPLTKGLVTTVDDDDYEYLNQFKWFLSNGYAYRRNGYGYMAMHREILRVPKGLETDHIDLNRLNNQRANLRVCTRRQNMANKLQRGSKTGFKGVVPPRPENWDYKYHAVIRSRNKQQCIAGFKNEDEPALAFDLWTYDLYGEFARTNFPIVLHSKKQ
jgi:hypothetical protein